MMYSRQELFDIAYVEVLKQGHPAKDVETEVCQYETEDGSHCAIGKIMLAAGIKHYKVWSSSSGIHFLKHLMVELDITAPWSDNDLIMLFRIQEAHDNESWRWESEFVKLMAEIATDYNLSVPKVETEKV